MRTFSTAFRILSPSPIFFGTASIKTKGVETSAVLICTFSTPKARSQKGWRVSKSFHPIKLERIGHFIENAFGNFQSLTGEFVNFVFRLEETGERDEDRDDGGRENVRAKVSGGFVVPENSE